MSAGILMENCTNCKVIGGSISGFDTAIVARDSRGISVKGMSMNTKTGIDAENCTELNFSNNQHRSIKPNYSYFQHEIQINNNTQLSIPMFYALNYLRAMKYNPYK
ncbi:hypothetical protein NMS86_003479 [Vibrio cholerae]|uniref:hypothetical protein n=1 Tax=Vibrio mimicus TaxID=674 RepID=UPI0012AC8F47|nr:hypothetical protein [Vibrio mimicus]EJL6860951.1 hypothetical protein [Vibrio cholerae]